MNLETKRLRLIPVTQKYTTDIFNNFTFEITTYMYPCPAKEINETKSIVDCWVKQRNDKTDYVYVITLKENTEFLGLVGLHNLNKEYPELGIWTKIASHGNHYGREAIGGVIEYAQKLRYKKLIYPVDTRNIASKKIPQFYGGKLVANNKLIITPDGRTLNEEVYEITL